MRNLILIVFFFPIFCFSQGFKWNWAVMNHTCPQELSSNYQIVDGDDGPKYMEIDSMGNVYVLGFIRNFDNNASFGTNTASPLNVNQTNYFTLLPDAENIIYLQKIDSTGNVKWVKNIQISQTWSGVMNELVVEPIDGTCFVKLDIDNDFYINGEPYISDEIMEDILVFDTDGVLVDHLEDIYVDILNGANKELIICKNGPLSGGAQTYDFYKYKDNEITFLNNLGGLKDLFFDSFQNRFIARVGQNLKFYYPNMFHAGTYYITDYASIDGDAKIYSVDRLGRVIFSWTVSNNTILFGIDELQDKFVHINFRNYFHPFSIQVDKDNNHWMFFHTYTGVMTASYPPNSQEYDVYPFVSPSTISNYALKIDVENDTLTGEYFAASNIDYSIGGKGFKINNKNEFFLAGGFRYEAEFSNTLLEFTCPGSLMPARKHYIAKAVVGEDTSRFTLNTISTELSFRLYPNPAQTSLTIESDQHVKFIRILDMTGKVLISEQNPNSSVFDVSALMNGCYIVEVTTEFGTLNQRFIKE